MKSILFTTLMTCAAIALSTPAFAKPEDTTQTVVKILVRNAGQIKLVDEGGKAFPTKQQLPSLISDILIAGYDAASLKGAKQMTLNQASADCEEPIKEEMTCTVYLSGTNFEIGKAGQSLTKLEDATGGWAFDVILVKKTDQWILKSNVITAHYAE